MQKLVNSLIKTTDTFIELVVIYVLIIGLAALGFSYFENKSLLDSLWLSAISALTIGYGDIYPVTLEGRIIAIIETHLVVLFMIPLITARLSSKLIVNSDVFSHTEQEMIKDSLEKIKKHLQID